MQHLKTLPDPPIRILRRRDVERLTGLRRSAIYEAVACGRLPRPVPIGARAVGWLESEVLDWLNSRIAQRNARATAKPEADHDAP